MIRSQRRRHFGIWLILAPILIGAAAYGLLQRPAMPVQSPIILDVANETETNS